MLSFVITAYFSVALLVVYYVFYFDPNADPFRSSHDRITQTEYPNTVDCVFCSAFRRARVFGLKRSSAEHRDERLESALDKVGHLLVITMALIPRETKLMPNSSASSCSPTFRS